MPPTPPKKRGVQTLMRPLAALRKSRRRGDHERGSVYSPAELLLALVAAFMIDGTREILKLWGHGSLVFACVSVFCFFLAVGAFLIRTR